MRRLSARLIVDVVRGMETIIFIPIFFLGMSSLSYAVEFEPLDFDIIEIMTNDTCEVLEGSEFSCLWKDSTCQNVMGLVYGGCQPLVDEAFRNGTSNTEDFIEELKSCQEGALHEYLQSRGVGVDDVCS